MTVLLLLLRFWQDTTVIDWVALSRLVPEVVLVVIFMYFTRDERKRAEIAETERTKIRLAEIAARDAGWREYLREERQHRVESMLRVADEIKTLAAIVATINATVLQHDAWERIQVEQIGLAMRKPGEKK